MNPKNSRRFVIAGALSICALAHAVELPRTILFIDDKDVLYRSGTKKTVHPMKKYKGNPVIPPNKPWESSIAWNSEYRDPKTGKFQMWYQAYSTKRKEDKRLQSVVCYAESEDGIHWVKPNLGLFPYYEEKDTNIVLIGSGGYGDRYCNSVVVDPGEKDPAKRYKMVYYDWEIGENARKGAGTHLAYSPDGIHWTKYEGGMVSETNFGGKGKQPPLAEEGSYSEETGKDGQIKRTWLVPITMSDAIDVFYDESKGAFVGYGKMWYQGPDGTHAWKHGMGRFESKDFIHWSKPELLLTVNDEDPPQLEFHTSPVFPYNGMYLSLNQIMDRSAGTIDVELISSRDGFDWDREFARIPVIERGQGEVFDRNCIFSNGTPIPVGDDLYFYYGAYRGPATGAIGLDLQDPNSTDYRSGIGLATTKKDRFVGVSPDAKAPLKMLNPPNPDSKKKPKPAEAKDNTIGQVTLKPLELSGVKEILVNANAEKGRVYVEILNDEGYRMSGFTKDDAVALTENHVAMKAAWKDKSLSDLPAGTYMIRVHLDNAELFACTLK